MKYAAFFICFFLMTAIQARDIFSLRQSNAILNIVNVLNENAEDLKVSYRITDQKFKIDDVSHCTPATANNALFAFKSAMDSILRLFPDEDIPYDEALSDMSNYLDQQPLTLCKFSHSDERHAIVTLYYFDKSDKIHLRIDTLSLLE